MELAIFLVVSVVVIVAVVWMLKREGHPEQAATFEPRPGVSPNDPDKSDAPADAGAEAMRSEAAGDLVAHEPLPSEESEPHRP